MISSISINFFFLVTNPSVNYFRHSSKTNNLSAIIYFFARWKRKKRNMAEWNGCLSWNAANGFDDWSTPPPPSLLTDERWKTVWMYLRYYELFLFSFETNDATWEVFWRARAYIAIPPIQFLPISFCFFLFWFKWKRIFYFVNCTVSDDVLPVSGIGLLHLRFF